MVEVVAGVELLAVGVVEVDADVVELLAAVELLEGVEGVEKLVERMAMLGVAEEEEEAWEELAAGEKEPAALIERLSLCAHITKVETVCDHTMSGQTSLSSKPVDRLPYAVQAAARRMVDVWL